ncbi:MAG: AAA family ATPase, partial [Prolixibacteraceae bacterium]|nr:AAA family ATPase [Prolixibacteraceae bacterium]
MIPVKLTIQGLYSYQEKQTIDFTRLTAAGLFGLFGTVGSGKSSVLEAITFAVYGRTDRLNLSGDNRYYNMMNLKSTELLIDFIFETGKNQTSYRSIVKGKRNGKNFEDVKALDRSAYKNIDGEWIPVEVKMMENAIGLSYDNFKRTIIIPQGQFQEFLQLSNKDRTLMMKELFNLGKYEFFYKVSSLESKNNEGIHNIEGQLKQLGDIDPVQVKLFRTNLEILEKELNEKNRELAESSKKEEELRHLKELFSEKQEAVKKYETLQNQLPEYKQLENRISRYEKCVSKFKHLLDSICLNNKKKEERGKQITADENNLKNLEYEISELRKQSEELKLFYDKRDTLKQKAGELMQLFRMKDLERLLAKEENRLKLGAGYLEKTVKKVDELKINKQNIDDQINSNRRKIPDLSLLSSVKSWYVGKHNLESQLSEIEKDIQEYFQQKESKEKVVMEMFPVQEGVGITKKLEI